MYVLKKYVQELLPAAISMRQVKVLFEWNNFSDTVIASQFPISAGTARYFIVCAHMAAF